MQRARRLAASATIVAMALGGVAACRTEPDVAAYIGAQRITEAQVEEVYSDAKAKLTTAVDDFRQQQAADPSASPVAIPDEVPLPIKRSDVVTALVARDVLKALVAQRGLRPAPADAEQVAQLVGLPAGARYTAMFTELQGYLEALAQAAKPVQVAERDLRDVYDRLNRNGGLQPNTSYDSFKSTLTEQNRQALNQRFGVRDDLLTEVRKAKASVNPRYGKAELALLSFRNPAGTSVPLIVLPFDAASGDGGPVRDLG